jgi:hypothetical protein
VEKDAEDPFEWLPCSANFDLWNKSSDTLATSAAVTAAAAAATAAMIAGVPELLD